MIKYRIIEQRNQFTTVEHVFDTLSEAKNLALELGTNYSEVENNRHWADKIQSDFRDFDTGIYGE